MNIFSKLSDWLLSFVEGLIKILPKLAGVIVLNLILISSVFKWHGATLTNQSVSLALMVLLLALFADLREFDFWGLKGKKRDIEELSKLAEDEGVAVASTSPSAPKKTSNTTSDSAEPIYLMSDLKTNFIYISLELEKLLRRAATVLTEGQISNSMPPTKIVNILLEKGLLTETGKEQANTVRKIRNYVVHGRDDEINDETLRLGWSVGYSLYKELKEWFGEPTQ